jgi:hypothetical protein
MNKLETALDLFCARIFGKLVKSRHADSNVWISMDETRPAFVDLVLDSCIISDEEVPLVISFSNQTTWICLTSTRLFWQTNSTATLVAKWGQIQAFCFDRCSPRWVGTGKEAKKVYDTISFKDSSGKCHDLTFDESLFDFFWTIFKLIIARNESIANNKQTYTNESGLANKQYEIWQVLGNLAENAIRGKNELSANEKNILNGLLVESDHIEPILIRMNQEELLIFFSNRVVHASKEQQKVWQNSEVLRASILPGNAFSVEIKSRDCAQILPFKKFQDATLAQSLFHQIVVQNQFLEDYSRM